MSGLILAIATPMAAKEIALRVQASRVRSAA
jgi:hypothetical protein